MARLLVALGLIVLTASGTALANHLDPQKKINARDQARARAMLLKRSDFGADFAMQRSTGPDPEVDCAGLDESDLTLTGDSESATFTQGFTSYSSVSQIYKSVGNANASWRRSTSAAGTRCLRETLRREFSKQAVRLVSLKKIAFPRVSARTAAYRVVLSAKSQGIEVALYVDVVLLTHSRAQTAVFFGSGLAAPRLPDELRVSRIVAERMKKAMRGA